MRLLIAALLIALPLAAQKAKPAAKAEETKPAKIEWDGEWNLKPSQSDKLEERIDEHVKDLNFAMKLWWKKKLKSDVPAFDKLDILAGESFSVTIGRETPIDTPTDGSVNEWKRRDGSTFKASLKKDGPTMKQVIEGDGYTLTLVYSMRPDGGSMAVQVGYSHPKLENPFSYKLVFRRNDA
jgi:hypothetical protein